MTIGFTVVTRHGEAQFHLRDHGRKDRPALVTQMAIPGMRVALMGRLYYRDDLRAGLDPVADPCNSAEDSDAALALAVYRQRGLAGLEHLEGDFALVIWDAGDQRLIGMRDAMGGYPIFYTVRRGVVTASTGMGPLLDSLSSRTLNQEYLADYLVASPGMEEATDGSTAYHGIQRVLSGSIVIFRLPTGSVEKRRTWDWLERQADPGTDDVAQLGEQCLDRLQAAVRTRLRGQSASHVSGGMDSTGVALIARDCLQGSQPFHALSLVYDRLPVLAQERPYLESALKEPGLVPHRINGEEVLDFDSLETVPVHDEPCPGLPRVWAAHHAMTAAAAQAGVATIMTGLGSDDIFNTEPFQLTELLRSGRLWAAWREASHWADAHNCNVWRFLGPYGFANLQPPWMRMGVGNWMRGGYGTLGRLTEWTIAPWIRPEFARRMDLRTRALASLRSNYYACRPVKLSLLLRFIRTYCGDFNRWYVAAPHGIVLTHPFLDPRMLSLGLGIQSRVLSRPGAQKPILAAALRGILPECILHRPYKRPFNEAHYMGLSANLRRLEALVKQAPVDDLDFLDKGAFLDCLQRTALGSAGDAEVLWPLNGTVSLLVWLSQQHGNFGRRHSVDAAPMVA